MRFVVLAALAIFVMASRRYAARYRVTGQHSPAGLIMRDAQWAGALRTMGAWRREVRTI